MYDKATLSRYDWPEQGYLLQIRFTTIDGALIPRTMLTLYESDIILLDPALNQYSIVPGSTIIYDPGDTPTWETVEEANSFALLYRFEGEQVPSPEVLLPFIQPRGALWLRPQFRVKDAAPIAGYIPVNPTKFYYAMFLEDQSFYLPDNQTRAINEPDEAFRVLENDLNQTANKLMAWFDGEPFIHADPPYASVNIGIDIKFPFAGTYRPPMGVGSVSAYNCELTLTAYDAMTHQPIATLTIGEYFGQTINVQVGVNKVWKNIPDLNSADSQEMDKFIKALNDFWLKP